MTTPCSIPALYGIPVRNQLLEGLLALQDDGKLLLEERDQVEWQRFGDGTLELGVGHDYLTELVEWLQDVTLYSNLKLGQDLGQQTLDAAAHLQGSPERERGETSTGWSHASLQSNIPYHTYTHVGTQSQPRSPFCAWRLSPHPP